MSESENKAVALKYNAGQDMAPVVIASGYGHIAEKIIDIAECRGIPVYRDDSAASLLCMLDVGKTIPPELYQVVATIYCQILAVASHSGKQPPAETPAAAQPAENP
ncbi:MAG: EscU/YscU/HrcU family type III secretion system export apparatus switch protein [Faecalibacterium sp.]|jgi:flagellar biosynthesis protein|nr:EscU/YscU/HrcU family type III secretion system export apparatus switch protein [Faecalibacterium sp.]